MFLPNQSSTVLIRLKREISYKVSNFAKIEQFRISILESKIFGIIKFPTRHSSKTASALWSPCILANGGESDLEASIDFSKATVCSVYYPNDGCSQFSLRKLPHDLWSYLQEPEIPKVNVTLSFTANSTCYVHSYSRFPFTNTRIFFPVSPYHISRISHTENNLRFCLQ